MQLAVLAAGACIEIGVSVVLWRRRTFAARSLRIEGRVAGHRTQMSDGDAGYAPIVEYEVEGVTHQVVSPMFAGAPRRIGSVMVVLHAPERAIIEGSGTTVFLVAASLAGVVLLVTGALGS